MSYEPREFLRTRLPHSHYMAVAGKMTAGSAKREKVCAGAVEEGSYLFAPEPKETDDVRGRAVAKANPNDLWR